MKRTEASAGDGDGPWLTVVVPVLNEAESIGATLDAVRQLGPALELVVVDGGSADDTRLRAEAGGARVIAGPRGRGSQMAAGAAVAGGEVLWFLHADTLPPSDAATHIASALGDPAVVGGNFEIRFDGDFAAARFLTWLYRHLALLGLRYGDSGYFVRRSDYEAVGGFRPYPIFEDLDLLRRLRKRGRFVRVPAVVTTSSRRFRGRSFALVFAWWAVLQAFYWVGVSPVRLGRWYRHVRSPGGRRSADNVKAVAPEEHNGTASLR